MELPTSHQLISPSGASTASTTPATVSRTPGTVPEQVHVVPLYADLQVHRQEHLPNCAPLVPYRVQPRREWLCLSSPPRSHRGGEVEAARPTRCLGSVNITFLSTARARRS
ncbi:hypothetical protein C8Q80DRAFT_1349836 [Daedaleopsis nitida]|nr:hypothetical protein C8Q80DRAFT_1349836 [Daedaleopsis nitida]